MEIIKYQGRQLYKWRVGASTFLAYPKIGARLLNWNLQLADGSTRDVIYWPPEADLANLPCIHGGNPILFPFAGRTYDKGEKGFWRAEDGIRRPMPQHGFARESSFTLTEVTPHGFIAILRPTASTRELYPYEYEFSVVYRFNELFFAVEFQLANRDQVPIPWSAGHHFYFALPWHAELQRKDYQIHIPARKVFHHAPDGRLVSVKKFLNTNTFDNPSLQDRLHTKLKSPDIVMSPRNGEEVLMLRIGSEKAPPAATAVVTWTETDESPFYCVEPWMSLPNSPEHEHGLHRVHPGQTDVFSIEVRLV